MTAYRGTITVTLSGVVDGRIPFSAIASVTMDLWNATLAPDGTVSGVFGGSGSMTFFGGGTSATEVLSFPSTPFSMPIDNPSLRFDTTILDLNIAWNDVTSFSPNRTAIYTSGSGTFSSVLDGVTVSGDIFAGGTLGAITTAFGIAAYQATWPEGGGNQDTSEFSFYIYRMGPLEGFATTTWQVAGSGANPAVATDFVGATMPGGTVTFAPHEPSRLITVPVLRDDLQEGDEGFVVTVPGKPGEVMSVVTSAHGMILNDDVFNISVAALAADVAEGGTGDSTAFTFTISRSGNTAQDAGVSWAVRGTGATPATAEDFVGGALPSGTVVFLPGETSQTVTVQVAGDSQQEAQESFLLELTAPTGGSGLGDSVAPGLIINDDGGIHQVMDTTLPSETFDLGSGSDLVRFSVGRAAYQIGALDNAMLVQGPGGSDLLVDVEWLKFGTEPAITRETLLGQAATKDLMRVLTASSGANQPVYAMPMRYAGPLDLAYVYPGTDNDDTVAGTPHNDFVNLAGGNDATEMGAGNDIIDGGGGSNFLTGGPGIDQFFLDGRFAVPVWSCITDWEIGESLVLWGWRPGTSVGAWGENAGMPGFLGATFFADIDGSGAVETVVTFAGRTVAEMPAPAMLDVGGIGVLKFG
jgi:Ca2+-binding RTX toxin-like protein